MSEIMRVLRPGSNCTLGGIPVKVLSVRIEALKISYEVSWILNGDRKTAWIEVFELDDSANDLISEALEVGFE